jgi:hypothetical protein
MTEYGERHMYQVQWIGVPKAQEFSPEAVRELQRKLRAEGQDELAAMLNLA